MYNLPYVVASWMLLANVAAGDDFEAVEKHQILESSSVPPLGLSSFLVNITSLF